MTGNTTRSFEIDWWPRRVVSGTGAVERLAQALDERGKKRVVLVCGRSIHASAAGAKLREMLGERLVGEFSEVEMHAPIPVLLRATDYIQSVEADAIVSLGGGSAIDSGKGICLLDRVGSWYASHAMTADSPGTPVPEPRLLHIAIPTTTGSGSEVTPTFGLRDPALGHKRIFRSDRLIPELAILDPHMAVEASARLTATSSMTAVARCIESLYSGRRNPFRTALALHGLRLLNTALPRAIAAPDDLDARSDCLVGSAMSAVAANVNTSAVHAIGHIVGGHHALQHGIAHTILLPSAMRLMLPIIGEEQKSVLFALGGSPEGLSASEAGSRAADRLADLIAKLPLPSRLREVGVDVTDLEGVAEQAARDPILRGSGAGLEAGDILTLLQSAF